MNVLGPATPSSRHESRALVRGVEVEGLLTDQIPEDLQTTQVSRETVQAVMPEISNPGALPGSKNPPNTRSRTRRLNTTYREEHDALPEVPAPLVHDNDQAPTTSQLPSFMPRARLRLIPFETPVDSFGRYRIYPSKPSSIPDSGCVPADFSDHNFEPGLMDSPPSDLSLRDAIAPCPNLSTFYFLRWFWKGANKSVTSREDLRTNVILNPDFHPRDLDGIDLRVVDRQLAASASTQLGGDTNRTSEGWVQKNVSIRVPMAGKGKATRPKSGEYLSVSGLRSRTILSGIRKGFSRNKVTQFHYVPFQSKWMPPGRAKSESQSISDEMYTSPAMLDAYKEVQRLEIADRNCKLPRVVAAVMLGSDGMQLGAFSTKKAWVLYMWLGNLSKYERCKPNSGSCFELAHIPSLPDGIKDEITKLNGRPPSTALLTHLRRELMHAVLHELLDPEFLHAWRHGIVIKCADGITRRVFPRIFTYAADYPERVLLATIRDKGHCPCPRCLVPMRLIHKMGTVSDMQKRTKSLRRDNLRRQKLIRQARSLIYDDNKAVGNTEVEALLQPQSLVPTENAFSQRLLPLKFDFYKIFVVDLLHEVELGVWKSLLTHLIRVLYGRGSEAVAEFNRRFRLVPTFSNSTIRKFSEDVASLKRLAARDFEDILQCCAPVFKGLLPTEIDSQVQELLFSLARWHALAKLRLHTSATLKKLADDTKKLGDQLRAFQAATADLVVLETPREFAARQRRAASREQNQRQMGKSQTVTRKRCELNLNTFKFHVLGDYVAIIAQNGTTDSFSTQATELQHRKIKAQWLRTNKRGAVLQMTRIGDIEDAINAIQERLDKRARNGATDDKEVLYQQDTGPYNIGQTDRTKDAVNIPLWVHSQGHNLAVKFFIHSLKQHLLSRITGDPNSTELGMITFQADRMYRHSTLHINYTSYDVRRQHDTINPNTPCRHILLPNDIQGNPSGHPFLYARVLGVYHANVRFHGRPPKRMDFVWVRWLDYDNKEPGGWDFSRLDRLSYGRCRNDSELLDAFGFIDPSNIIRAAHLIPDFNSGITGSPFPANSEPLICDSNDGDWEYHYVNRFVDRDMVMRYLGGGIGHFGHSASEGNESESDSTYEITGDETEEIELENELNEGYRSNHHEQDKLNSQQGSDLEEDLGDDLSAVGSDEEADSMTSDEESFIDDLYDL
ncbi:hypothetical protein FS749_004132 [Ceratobasidium sp. UAMH 11750]|nr:hypothetical protein FS749_004132 [Ceratobasidium sp. UAMH 11750]